MPGMGFLVVDRTTKAEATGRSTPTSCPTSWSGSRSSSLSGSRTRTADRASSTASPCPTTRNRPRRSPQDDRQADRQRAKDQTFDLTVTAIRQPPTVAAGRRPNPGKEFTESNYFLTSDDPLVKQHAAEAVGGETDPWEKASAVERWVNQHMKVQNFTEAMAPAFVVAKTLTGDCTEYSMLAAAMCRAVGVPSRTAIGLVYVDAQPPGQPLLGFPHVDGGVRPRPMGGDRRDARPGQRWPGAREDHGRQLARHAVDDAAVAADAGDDRPADGRDRGRK